MAFSVTWSVSGETGPGAQPFSDTLSVEAVERVSAGIEPGAEEEFEILADQPERLLLLVISASRHADVSIGQDGASLRPMPGPMITSGAMLRFLNGNGTSRVVVNNAGADPLTVDILVCRDPGA